MAPHSLRFLGVVVDEHRSKKSSSLVPEFSRVFLSSLPAIRGFPRDCPCHREQEGGSGNPLPKQTQRESDFQSTSFYTLCFS
jgi:hypothetical protein